MNNRFWFPFPTQALRVIVGLEQEQTLDLLSETILRLIKIEARSAEDIEQSLGMPIDLVLSALSKLTGDNLAVQISGGCYKATESEFEFGTRDLQSGWVFFCPHSQEFLPRVWIGEELPKFEAKQAHEGQTCQLIEISPSEFPGLSLPERNSSIDKLKRLATNPELIARFDSRFAQGSVVERINLEGFPQLELEEYQEIKIASIMIDKEVNETRKGQEATTTWGMVELLAGIDGRVSRVYRRPELFPEPRFADLYLSDKQRNDDRLNDWIVKEFAALENRLKEKEDLVREDNSTVLKLANLTLHKVKRLSQKHWKKRLLETKIDSLERTEQSLIFHIERSQRNLIIWQAAQTADSYLTATSSYFKAIEELGKSMRRTPLLESYRRYGAYFKKLADNEKNELCETEFNKKAIKEKIESLGLSDQLRDSVYKLQKAVEPKKKLEPRETLEDTLRRIEKGQLGAGESLLIWLLPLVLSPQEEFALHLCKIQEAFDAHEALAKDLAFLVDCRNIEGHNKEEKTFDIVDVDRRLFAVAAALFGNRSKIS